MPAVPRVLLFPALGAAGVVKAGAVAGTGVRSWPSATSKKGNRKRRITQEISKGEKNEGDLERGRVGGK